MKLSDELKWIDRALAAYVDARDLYDQLYELAAKQDAKLAVALSHNANGFGAQVHGSLELLRDKVLDELPDFKACRATGSPGARPRDSIGHCRCHENQCCRGQRESVSQ